MGGEGRGGMSRMTHEFLSEQLDNWHCHSWGMIKVTVEIIHFKESEFEVPVKYYLEMKSDNNSSSGSDNIQSFASVKQSNFYNNTMR